MCHSPVFIIEQMKETSFQHDILPLKDKLFRTALRITLDTAEAEDIVQETLIRIWHKREEWSNMDSIEAYCQTICRNLALDRAARLSNQNIRLEDAQSDPASAHTPQDTLENKDYLHIVRQLLEELPEAQQQVLEQREIEGKSYKEIAQTLRLTEEQVKVNLFRARQKIKKRFLEIEIYGL